MGRSTTTTTSTSSCFKIITCGGGGGDSDEKDDLLLPPPLEIKGSSDKRGWSFRKRSARHRVLSNTVISENLASASKEGPESVDSNVEKADASAAAAAVEKLPVVDCQDEKPGISVFTEQKVVETVGVENAEAEEVDSQPEESVIIVIQTAIRGFLAQRELLRLKNVVKLQAAVRGHMVRQHAVGTLRCVQAIVKMQALVRSHHARQSKEGPFLEKESDQKCGTVSKTLDKEQSVNVTHTSIEKLLSNSFARQLIESTPKSKPINIKCDPLKPNSAWNWLERWMSVSSGEPRPKTDLKLQVVEKLEVMIENINYPAEGPAPSEGTCDPLDMKTDTKEIVLPSEGEENLIIYEAENLKFEAIGPTVTHDINLDPSNEKEASTISNSIDNLEQPESNSKMIPHDPHVEGEQPNETKQCIEKPAMDQLETEGKKYVFGPRKASNQSFIASQSKFEELSSTGTLNRSSSKGLISSNMDTFLSGFETATRANEDEVLENTVPHSSALQYGGSECGTELSITSTLDSPDGTDAGAANDEHEAKVAEEQTYNSKGTEECLGTEAKGESVNPVPNSASSVAEETEKFDGANGESLISCAAANTPQEELKPERNASDIQIDGDSETGVPACPEASPRSHVTVPESQGTPSSQVSVKAKRSRTDKGSSSLKRKSLSAGKGSPSHLSYEAVARSSIEQLPKDQRNAKRRNSFGSTRPENTEEEPRDSGSSNSLPHFMQVTESARAKMNPSSSPRSSPDVQDREYVKKRHSLPGANGRQGSPRIQRSMSQAQQGTKGNGGYVVHEKKWQR